MWTDESDDWAVLSFNDESGTQVDTSRDDFESSRKSNTATTLISCLIFNELLEDLESISCIVAWSVFLSILARNVVHLKSFLEGTNSPGVSLAEWYFLYTLWFLSNSTMTQNHELPHSIYHASTLFIMLDYGFHILHWSNTTFKYFELNLDGNFESKVLFILKRIFFLPICLITPKLCAPFFWNSNPLFYKRYKRKCNFIREIYIYIYIYIHFPFNILIHIYPR